MLNAPPGEALCDLHPEGHSSGILAKRLVVLPQRSSLLLVLERLSFFMIKLAILCHQAFNFIDDCNFRVEEARLRTIFKEDVCGKPWSLGPRLTEQFSFANVLFRHWCLALFTNPFLALGRGLVVARSSQVMFVLFLFDIGLQLEAPFFLLICKHPKDEVHSTCLFKLVRYKFLDRFVDRRLGRRGCQLRPLNLFSRWITARRKIRLQDRDLTLLFWRSGFRRWFTRRRNCRARLRTLRGGSRASSPGCSARASFRSLLGLSFRLWLSFSLFTCSFLRRSLTRRCCNARSRRGCPLRGASFGLSLRLLAGRFCLLRRLIDLPVIIFGVLGGSVLSLRGFVSTLGAPIAPAVLLVIPIWVSAPVSGRPTSTSTPRPTAATSVPVVPCLSGIFWLRSLGRISVQLLLRASVLFRPGAVILVP